MAYAYGISHQELLAAYQGGATAAQMLDLNNLLERFLVDLKAGIF